jgi:hypothetical protein
MLFENIVLRKILRPKRDEVTGKRRTLHYKEVIICTPPQILYWRLKLTRMR